MSKNIKDNPSQERLFSNLKYVFLTVTKLEKGLVFLSFSSIILVSFSSFTGSFILKEVINDLELGIQIKQIIIKALIILVIMATLAIVSTILENVIWWRIIRLRTKVIIEKNEKVLTMDYQTLENPEIHDMADKANVAVSGNYVGFEGMFNNSKRTLENLFAVIIASFIIVSANPWLIFITISLVIVKFLARNKVSKIDKVHFWDVIPPYRRKLQYINSVAKNSDIAKDLRIYDMKGFIEKEQGNVQQTVHEILKASEYRKLKLETFLQFVSIIQEASLYAILIYEVFKNNLTIGDFTFMLSSVRILSSQLTSLFSNYVNLLSCSRQVNDLRIFMEFDEEKNRDFLVLPIKDCYAIEFRNVYFRYYKQDNYALEDISFVLKPNQKLALVGYNGAGKTTLIKLLCGLYKPEKGEIYLNGVNINNYKKDDYYKLFAPVFQEVHCYAFDIGENVAMKYQSNVDYEKAYNSLVLAGLKDKIDSLPKKMKTTLLKNLDEEGTEFSGGESQKLCLARAIYKNAKFMILDEPTSALDALAEYNMYVNFNEIVAQNSAIYISHRLASTRFCDEIILLKDGKIIEKGTHEELLSLNGEYRNLFDIQAQYYREEEESR